MIDRMRTGLCAAAVWAVAATAPAKERYGWEGTLDLRVWAEGGPSLTGVCDTRWHVAVRLEEGRRIAVRDRHSTLVGQFVELKDAGSQWSGAESGSDIARTAGGTHERRYSGQGSGTGPALSCGWIYWNLSDRDPLAATLPNGAYAMASGPSAVPAFDTACLTTDTDRHRTSSYSTPFTRLAMLQYCIGRFGLAANPGRWPDEVRAEDKAGAFQFSGPAGHDREMRVAQGDTMTGSYHGTSDMGMSLGRRRTLHAENRWNLKRVRLVDARLARPDRFWRPKGGPESNTIVLEAWIAPEEKQRGKFRFTLSEVSNEKGWAMNAGEGTEPDLEFDAGQAGFSAVEKAGDTWRIETVDLAERAAVTIRARDYGAWGRLAAEVNVDGAWRACKADDDGAGSVALPLDANGDRIADQWARDWSVSDQTATDDRDSQPEGVGDPDEPGDGFTNYEEYRGFVIRGRWDEGDPRTREVFVRDEIGCGIGCFAALGFNVRLIDPGEYDGQRVVNFNRGHASAGPQKGIRLRSEALASIDGEVRPCVGSPNAVTEVVIDSGGILPDDAMVISDDLSNTIGHELAHAVNVMHHGNDDARWTGHADDITAAELQTVDRRMVATRGGKWSGHTACAMVYDRPRFYVGSDRLLHRFPSDGIPTKRLTFCNDQAGTGINAGPSRIEDGLPYPVAGDATWAPCLPSVDVKGVHRYGDQPGW